MIRTFLDKDGVGNMYILGKDWVTEKGQPVLPS